MTIRLKTISAIFLRVNRGGTRVELVWLTLEPEDQSTHTYSYLLHPHFFLGQIDYTHTCCFPAARKPPVHVQNIQVLWKGPAAM